MRHADDEGGRAVVDIVGLGVAHGSERCLTTWWPGAGRVLADVVGVEVYRWHWSVIGEPVTQPRRAAGASFIHGPGWSTWHAAYHRLWLSVAVSGCNGVGRMEDEPGFFPRSSALLASSCTSHFSGEGGGRRGCGSHRRCCGPVEQQVARKTGLKTKRMT